MNAKVILGVGIAGGLGILLITAGAGGEGEGLFGKNGLIGKAFTKQGWIGKAFTKQGWIGKAFTKDGWTAKVFTPKKYKENHKNDGKTAGQRFDDMSPEDQARTLQGLQGMANITARSGININPAQALYDSLSSRVTTYPSYQQDTNWKLNDVNTSYNQATNYSNAQIGGRYNERLGYQEPGNFESYVNLDATPVSYTASKDAKLPQNRLTKKYK